MGQQVKKLSDGTFLVASDNVNIDQTHLHVGVDSRGVVVLSDKVNGVHSYRFSDSRVELSQLWEQITGEKNKFPGGWRPQ